MSTQGNWIFEIGSATPGGGSVTPPVGPPAPPVTIVSATVTPRSDGTQQIEVNYTIPMAATVDNFAGVHVYLEDPDISALPPAPMDGSTPLDGSSQVSGKWNPKMVTTSTMSPATVLADGDTAQRFVRVYLLSYGPHTNTPLVRANAPQGSGLPVPTPSIRVTVPPAAAAYVSGQEYCWQVLNPKVVVNPHFDDPAGANYTLRFSYTPPDPSTPLPPGMEPFGGVDIWYAYLDGGGNIVAITPTGIWINVLNSGGYDSAPYTPSQGTNSFLVFFVSRGLENHANTLVPGVTPSVPVTITYPPDGQGISPSVSALAITPTTYVRTDDGSILAQATLSWTLPAANPRYSGVNFYVTAIDAVRQPHPLWIASADNHTTQIPISTNQYPPVLQKWTITAISVGDNNQTADDPANPHSYSPHVDWSIGPPGAPGSSGNENAPLVNLAPMAATVTDQQLSSDGVQMMRFTFTGWANPGPADPRVNQFGGVKIAMQDSHGITYFDAGKATSFTTPWMAAVIAQTLQFYWVSYDPQNKLNTILGGVTPERDVPFTPVQGQIIPTRAQIWWSPEFSWPAGGSFQAQSFNAVKINVGQSLVVGGAPNSFGGANGSPVSNGQIAVLNSAATLVGWIGTQQPTQGNGAATYGAWFGQLWVGGHDPRDAPIWVNNQGIVIVGGIQYQSAGPPFISIRNQFGTEVGKMGAQLNLNSSGAVIPLAPAIAGAWFSQFALGGPSVQQWKVLADVDSTVKMRDINQFQITWPQNSAGHTNHATILAFGLDAYAINMSTFSFPGITLYDTTASANFGVTIINRGLVLTGYQGFRRATLNMFNGVTAGDNNPQNFWAEMAFYNPFDTAGAAPNVYLASGYSPSAGVVQGDSQFYLKDRNSVLNFQVDISGNVTMRGSAAALNYSVGAKAVIDQNGNWVGNPISTTGGVASLNGLTGVLSVVSNNSLLVSTPGGGQVQVVINPVLINTSGAFVGAGVDVGVNGVRCHHLDHDTFGPAMDTTGAWVGKGAACPNDRIGAKALGTWTGSGYTYGLAETFTFTTADGKTITVTGGLITAHTP